MNLELVESSELLDELANRFDYMIFIGATTRGPDEFQIWREWKGNTHTCVGLATDIGNWLLTDLRNKATPA